jgi:4-amino-4-deoxy-L-arabinose transferase-like glycosyltransferase
MERGGDRLVPRWNGAFDAEKPPLVYWLMAASGRLAGEVDPVAARLPCALLAGLSVLLTAALARRWFGEPAIGVTAALLYATSELVLWNSSRAGMDFPMTAFALLATWFATSLVARPSFATATACGASLGLALLAKGPHAFYVPVGA